VEEHPTAIALGLIKIDGVDAEFIPPVNFRDHMNQFATESAREIYGDNHWVDILLPLQPTPHNPEGWPGSFLVAPRSEADFPYSFAHFAVITDLRAYNELGRVKELGGLCVKIKRRDAEEEGAPLLRGEGHRAPSLRQ
jgi:hypothetical protein